MIVTNSTREKNTVTVGVALDAAEFEKYVDGAYRKNKSKIQVAGFRKGRAPRMVIEGMYGKDVFYDDAINDAAPDALTFAIEQEKLEIVGRPSVESADVTEEKGLALGFKVDVWPEVTLGDYKGLQAEKSPATVTDEAVEEEIQRLRKQNGRLISVEREAQNGDSVNIDYVGTIDGVAFEGGSAESQNLTLGSGDFIPGFEDGMLGMKPGEERDVSVTFPEDYAEELAGKEAVFHVKVNEIKEEELPEVDDEFAKDNDFDTMDELREDIRKRELENAQRLSDNMFEDKLVDMAVENMTVEIPESMIQERMNDIANEYAQYLGAQGVKLEDYLTMTGTDMKSFLERNRPTAEKQTRTEVLLKAVAQAEAIDATEEELEAELADLAGQYGMKVEDVKKAVDMKAVKDQLLRKKAVRVIVDNAVALEPKEAAEAESAEAE